MKKKKQLGGKQWEKNVLFLLVYSTHKQLHREFVLYRNVYSTQAQPALSSSLELVRSVHCLATLDIMAANRLSHHPELPGRPIHGEVDGLDIGRQHGRPFCHTPCLQAVVETSDSGAEAVKSDTGSSWEVDSRGWVLVSGLKMRCLVRPLRIPLVLSSLRRTYVVIVR